MLELLARGREQRQGPRVKALMQVLAFSTASGGRWKWRIVNYGGEMIEESREQYPTIAEAVAQGAGRLTEMNVQDISRMERSFSPRRSR